MFAPTDLDITITPQSIAAAIMREEFSLAINMALHLGEVPVLKQAVDAVKVENIDMVVLSVDIRMLKALLMFIAQEMVSIINHLTNLFRV